MFSLILRNLRFELKRSFLSGSCARSFGALYFHSYQAHPDTRNNRAIQAFKCSFSTDKNGSSNKDSTVSREESDSAKEALDTAALGANGPESRDSTHPGDNALKSDPDNKPEAEKGEESGEDKADGKSDEKKFRFLPFGIYGGATLVFSGFALSYYIDRGNDIKDLKLSQLLDDVTQYMYDRIEEVFPTDNSPLLPDFDELKYPPNLPTLVVDLDKVIAKMEYDRKLGWQVKKRPYADKFFKELINYYEIVIWSDDSYPVAYDIANLWGLPVIGCIHRDHCKKFKGGYIKDLSRLGRDLRRVILIDHDRIACTLQEENSILVKEFDGDESDEELLYLINLLKTIAINPQDVKVQIKQLGGGQDYQLGRRFAEQFSLSQEKAKSRMNMTKMLGFKHYQ